MQAENPQDEPEGLEGDVGKQERERSTISFPYMDLDDALAVASGIQRTSGPSPCTHDQLAAELNLSMNSSGYRMRLSAARIFGLIDTERGGGVRLTALGLRSVDETQARRAKVDAFLSVPLYRALVEELRGKVVPPPAALERVIAALGVSPKQTDRARQAFERSAQSAGFFDKGRDKLVSPAFNDGDTRDKQENKKGSGGGRGGNGEDDDLHPLIQGLVAELPNKREEWPVEKRVHWLQIAVNTFSLLYGNQSEEEIVITVELRKKSVALLFALSPAFVRCPFGNLGTPLWRHLFCSRLPTPLAHTDSGWVFALVRVEVFFLFAGRDAHHLNGVRDHIGRTLLSLGAFGHYVVIL